MLTDDEDDDLELVEDDDDDDEVMEVTLADAVSRKRKAVESIDDAAAASGDFVLAKRRCTTDGSVNANAIN